MNSPMFMAVAFSLLGLWMVFALLPGLRKPPLPETKNCPVCGDPNPLDGARCQKCGATMTPDDVDKESSK